MTSIYSNFFQVDLFSPGTFGGVIEELSGDYFPEIGVSFCHFILTQIVFFLAIVLTQTPLELIVSTQDPVE